MGDEATIERLIDTLEKMDIKTQNLEEEKVRLIKFIKKVIHINPDEIKKHWNPMSADGLELLQRNYIMSLPKEAKELLVGLDNSRTPPQ